MEFTFAVITFNHENIILENLESMKYQINRYGKGIEVDFVLSDDCSKDGTVKIVEKWVEINKELFRNVNIMTSNINLGTVENFEKTLKSINTNYFKLLAGDDLYYNNNIFDLGISKEMIITPVMKYDGNIVVDDLKKDNFYSYIRNKKNIKQYLRKRMTYYMCLETPGIFYDLTLIRPDLFEQYNGVKLIEDVILWIHILNNAETTVDINCKPRILYRVNSGISNNHVKMNNIYLNDLEIIKNKYFKKYNYKFLFIHPYKIYNFFHKKICSIINLFIKDVNYAKKELQLQKDISNIYISEIKKNVDEFKNNYLAK